MSISRTILILSAFALAAPLTAQETREVETVRGAVSVPADPQRILVLNPAIAGSVYALGFDVLGVVQSTRAPTEEGYSSVWAEPARAAGTEVLAWNFEGFNFEEILGYEPDLIVAGGQGRPGFLADAAYDQLNAIAPTVFVDTTPTTWQNEIAYLAEILDRHDEASAAITTYENRVAEVGAAIALPAQPTVFMLSIEVDNPYFLPDDTATPLLFADVGFELDPVSARFPDAEAASTGDSVQVSPELATEAFSAPTIVLVPWSAESATIADLEADPILSRLPAVEANNVHVVPDYAYRFDYYGALATLDVIEETFAQ